MMGTLKHTFSIILIFLFTLTVAFASGGDPKKTPPTTGMVKITSGEYSMFFDNNTGKKVKVKSFFLDTRAVTNSEFLEFVKSNPKWARSKVSKLFADAGYLKHWKGDYNIGNPKINNSPVTNVSWYAANAYSKWKNKRLPTLAEWEYVGNASLINDKRQVEKVILDWYSKPTPQVLPSVGTSFKNKFNVSDMHGLIWEWVYDFNSIVMNGDSRSNNAVQRDLFCASGSFGAANKEDYAAFMRFAFRGSLKAKYTVSNLGFRCALDAQ